MPVFVDGEALPISGEQIQSLWNAAKDVLDYGADDTVTVRSVSKEEIQTLNNRYRHKDTPTNVLTFTYPKDEEGFEGATTEHDVALCMDVVSEESKIRALGLEDYTALVITHGFLHALGLDHEQSEDDAVKMHQLERKVLETNGFKSIEL